MWEIFVLTFKAHGPHCIWSTRLECHHEYFLIWTSGSVNKSILLSCFLPHPMYFLQEHAGNPFLHEGLICLEDENPLLSFFTTVSGYLAWS